MGKADYLKKISKSNKAKSSLLSSSSNVTVLKLRIIPKVENNPIIANEVTGTKEQFKGFKRIDNGERISLIIDDESPEVESKLATIYRDRSGKVIDVEEKKREFDAKQAKRMEPKWKEIRLTESELLTHTAGIPMTHVKQRQRQHDLTLEDPMAKISTPSQSETATLEYSKGVHIPNRFGIKAGCFWDGVDRGNGFEALLMAKRTEDRYHAKEKTQHSANDEYDEF